MHDQTGVTHQGTTLENSGLRFRDAAICYHYIARVKAPGDWKEPCPVFNTFESDLMDFQHRARPPIRTHCLTGTGDSGNFRMEIRFPASYEFLSEGREYEHSVETPRLPVEYRLSVSIFKRSKLAVVHIVIRPMDGHSFNEYDLIRLSKLAGSDAENSGIAGVTTFEVPVGGPCKVKKLAANLLADSGLGGFKLVGGTLAIETGYGNSGTTAESVTLERLLDALNHPKEKAICRIESLLKGDQAQADRIRAYVGIISGILDFRNLDAEEIMDTVFSTARYGSQYLAYQRDWLISLVHEDRSVSQVRDSVGMSPYLLIPNAVILQNEWLLKNAKRSAHKALTKHQPPARELEILNRQMEESLAGVLGNVFHYPTERALFKSGFRMRGSLAFHDRVVAMHHRLEGEIRRAWKRQEAETDRRLSLWVMAMAALQVPAFWTLMRSESMSGLEKTACVLVIGLILGSHLFRSEPRSRLTRGLSFPRFDSR